MKGAGQSTAVDEDFEEVKRAGSGAQALRKHM
jgi:hypothetical protein